MALAPLAEPDDIVDIWRPLTPDEGDRVFNLITKASVLLRQRCPWVDARVATYNADPTNPAGLSPVLVATVVANVVKRFLSNQAGIASEGVGGWSVSFALKTDKGIRGELDILAEDIEKLTVSSLARAQLMTMRVKAGLAPSVASQLQQAEATLDVYVPDGTTGGNYPWTNGA